MGKTLRADIVIGGKADSSFYRLGSALETLGTQINLVSDKLIQYDKESVNAYTSYEDYILDAEVALRTQYESTSELGKAMEQLNKSALQWANDSRFTTEDVAGAISNAAHAGWDLQQILNGVPSAMDVSRAGGMELAEGLEYLVDISNAAGIGFEDLSELVDVWAYAANRSSTTIPEMGQAMQKMGATMQFVKGDMAGLTTMLAMLANNGAKGTEAGTLLRNSMIRLIAPTQKAAEAIDGLNMTAEDLDEIYGDSESLERANQMLEEAGFSAYNAKGELKSFLTIFEELNEATSGMSEEDRNSVLSAIFPTRTITGALALLEAAADDWDGLYDSIRSSSEGYAEYASETMESGLGGSLRHLESVYNALQTRSGEALSEDVSWVTDAISGLIEKVNSLDNTAFDALVSGLEAVAVAGPGLMAAGGAIKLFEAIRMTGPIGKVILLGTALAAVAAGLQSVAESSYEADFGTLGLDMDSLSGYVSGLGNQFDAAQKQISQYNDAVEQAIGNYETASSTLKDGLLTKMLTGDTLTQRDIRTLNGLGDQMRQALIDGIDGSYSSAESTARLFAQDSGLLSGVLDTLDYGYQQAITRAEQLSAELRSAMTGAFSDGALTSDEIDNIQSILNQQNELLAMQADAQNAVERQKMLRQAQTLGLDALEEISTLAETQRETELATLEDTYWQAYYQTEFGGRMKIQNGARNADGTLYTQADLDRELAALTEGYDNKRLATQTDFDRMLLDLYESTANGSDLRDVWDALGAMADEYLATGTRSESSLREYQSTFGIGERTEIRRYLDEMADAFGGTKAMQERADYYARTGDMDSANAFARLIAMVNYSTPVGYGPTRVAPGVQDGQNYYTRTIYDTGSSQEMTLDVAGDTTMLAAAIEEEDGQTLTAYVDGDTTMLGAAIAQFAGKTISLPVSGYLGKSGIGGFFAEGGRATEPSIFGEGGAEWAIPEEHTQRTAELLNAARAASGFTWPELLGRNGGLNAGAKGSWTLVYSPTIVAGDAAGVEQKLKDDKDRLEKWLKDKQLRDELEVYS